MLTKTYRPYDPDQMFLMPPALQEWLPEGHLVYFISDVVEQLDLSCITSVYEDEHRGYPPYHPLMLTKILLYAYCIGVPSSRKIDRRCEEDIGFRILAANNQPDFRTISDFRKRHLESLKGIFKQVLRLCQKTGLVKLGHVALDGTKLKANASKHKAMSYGRMLLKEEELEKEVEELLRSAQEMDEEEDQKYGKDRRGDELPKELAFKESRLKKIREAKEALEREAASRAEAKAEEIEARQSEKPRRGRKPKPPDPIPDSQDQRNFTDPESQIMVNSATKSFEQAYNCQVAVDDKEQVIVACEVTQEPNDKKQLEPMTKAVQKNTGKKTRMMSADAGYWNAEKIEKLSKGRTEFFIPPDKQKHNDKVLTAERGRIPKNLSFADRMRRKLRTKKGRGIYSKRKETAEPVFGQIKQGRGFRQFLLRGKEKVRGEWSLICTTHNLLKLWRSSAVIPCKVNRMQSQRRPR